MDPNGPSDSGITRLFGMAATADNPALLASIAGPTEKQQPIWGSGSSGTENAFQLSSSVITGSESDQSAPQWGHFVPKGSGPQNATVPERQKQP
jgi:hypothetical protein